MADVRNCDCSVEESHIVPIDNLHLIGVRSLSDIRPPTSAITGLTR